MSMPDFAETFAPKGALRLGSWSMQPSRDDMVHCQATIAFDDRIMSMQASAAGPIGAMTSMLHDLGAPLQIITLHQRETDGLITTFLLCEHDNEQFWVYGDGTTSDQASVNAMIADANRLLAA